MSDAELEEAVYELHQYLSDRLAPLMVADSIGLLLGHPPEFMAAQIQAWMAGQDLSLPVSDYLFHGAKKIGQMGEFELVPKETLSAYLSRLAAALLPYCPEEDRAVLAQNLERLTTAAPAASGSVAVAGVIHRQQGGGPETALPGVPAPGMELTRELRRLTLLLEHLRPLGAAQPERRTELASQFIAAAAAQSHSAQDLERNLAPLRELGVATGTDEVFKTLARTLAGWALPVAVGPEGEPVVAREQLAAMRRIVATGANPAETAQRFREMVHAAIEQFNEGNLGRAATMFGLAERLVAEQQVKGAYVDALRGKGHEYLEAERLRRYAERADLRPSLRCVLNFFTALQPAGLLKALDGEARRERRHELLALLEVHEQAARAAAWQLLEGSVQDGARVDPFFQMNLVYLLRIVPRPEAASPEAEVDIVMKTSGRAAPPPLVKQTIAFLAQTRHEKAERALMTYLRVFESMLLQPTTAAYEPADVETLLDRTCVALVRYGTPRAWRALIDHGLKAEARLGNPFLRLAEAGRVDLSASRELVTRVVAAVRAELPKGGVMAFATRTNEEKLIALIQALAGTPLPEVEELYREVMGRFTDRKFGEAAAKALASLAGAGQQAPAPASISGDLELFGLPNLLQTLSQSGFSGILSLMSKEGRTLATVILSEGHLRGGQFGVVLGEEAIYQLLERPFPGTFAFVPRSDVDSLPRVGPPQDFIPLLMEGVRRHDEFNRAAGIVPDQAHFKPTGQPHAIPADEDDDFAGLVWSQAAGGKTAQQCEEAISTDSYRVRRLLAAWVEEGALRAA